MNDETQKIEKKGKEICQICKCKLIINEFDLRSKKDKSVCLDCEEKKELFAFKKEAKILYVDGSFKHRKVAVCDEKGDLIQEGWNTKVDFQIEIELFALLKAMFIAKEQKWKKVLIYTDHNQVNFEKFKSKTLAGRYQWIAKKIADEEGIEVKFVKIDSAENKADWNSRN